MSTPPEEDPHPPPPPHPHPTRIEFELLDPLALLSPTNHANIITWTSAIFNQLKATGSVRAKIVNDTQMSLAHKQFSGIDGTTDVLTFDYNDHDSSESKTLDTDLIICHDQAARQAPQHNHTTAHELLLYIIHGTLHCLGYNDHTPESFAKIHAREDELLTTTGIGPLFDPFKTNKSTKS